MLEVSECKYCDMIFSGNNVPQSFMAAYWSWLLFFALLGNNECNQISLAEKLTMPRSLSIYISTIRVICS